MDHIYPVFKSDPDDIVLGEISTNGGHSLSNLICFIGLEDDEIDDRPVVMNTDLLTMCR